MGLLSGWKSKRKREDEEAEAIAEDPTPVASEAHAPAAVRSDPEPPRRMPAVSPAAPAAPARPATSLRDDLIALADRGLARLDFAKAVVDRLVQSPTIAAAALLSFHARDNRLEVIVANGISEAASRVLSGEASGEGQGRWDIPLRGLISRRINVIEAANENPFVPQPLKDVSPRRLTIVTIPFYHGPNPVGAALVFVPLEKGFSDLRLQQLTQAVRVCSAAFVDPSEANALPAAAPPAARPSAAAPTQRRRLPSILGEELGRLKEAIEEAERQRAAEASERVTAESFLRAERDKGAALERDLAALRAEIESLREATAAGEAARAAERSAREALARSEAESAEAKKLLEGAEQKALGAAKAVEELTRIRYGLQAELAEARADAVARGEEGSRSLVDLRAQSHALTREVATLRQDLAGAEMARRQAEKEGRDRGAELAKVRAALDAAVEESHAARTEAERALAEERSRSERAAKEAEQQRALLARHREESERAILEVREAVAKEAIARRSAESAAAELSQRLVALEEGRGSLADQVATLTQAEEERARLAALVPGLERDLGEARAAIARLEQEREERAAQVERALTEERTARSGVDEELARLHRALDDERRNSLTAVEALRRETAREVAAVRAELSGAIEDRARVEPELARLRAAAESLSAELDREREARRELAALLDRERETHLATTKAADEALAAVHLQRDEAVARLVAVEHEARAGNETVLSVRSELEAAMRARVDLESAIAGRERQWAEERTQAERTRAEAIEQLRLAGAENERRMAESEAARRALEERTSALQAEHERIVADWESRFARAESEFQARVEELEALQQDLEQAYEGELGRLRQELEGGEVGQGESYALEGLSGDDAGDLAIDRSSEPRDLTIEPLPEPQPAPPPPPRPGIFFIDDALPARQAAAALDEPERPAAALSADAKGFAVIADRPDAVLVVNLAQPNVLAAVRALRTREPSGARRIYGYALAPGSAKGFWLGPVDFALLPFVDGVDIASAIRRAVPGAKRALAMSGDIDLMGDVRARLATAKMSTAVVFDGRQALDLVPTVRPEAAILHLTPTSTDVFSAVVGFRSADNSRHIPIVFLLDTSPHAREEGFLGSGLRLLGGRPNFEAAELAGLLAATAIP